MNRELLFDRPPAWLNAGYLARVVSLDDPEGLNRVQVRLIAYDGVDGQDAPLWARVVAPFAGQDRGAFFMPDVDDEVLVLFTSGDTRFPLVLGGLWNGAATAHSPITTAETRFPSAVPFAFVTLSFATAVITPSRTPLKIGHAATVTKC